MKHSITRTAIIIVLLTLTALNPVLGQFGGDLLNEAPLVPIPKDMTYEEYQDMNRRLTVGLVLSAIHIPGMIHFYAGEKKTGWIIFGTATLGVGTLIAGAASLDDGKFPDSDLSVVILNPGGGDKERRYEKIPMEITNADTTYRLQEIFREKSGGGGVLVLIGAALIIGDIAYDFIHGIRVIEEKRDRVRFKYGKTLSLGLNPDIDLSTGSAGLRLSWYF